MKRLGDISLKVKMMFLMSSIVIVAAVVIATAFVSHNKQHISNEFDIRIQSSVNMAAKSLELPVMIKQKDEIDRMLESLMHTPDLVYVAVYDSERELLSQQGDGAFIAAGVKKLQKDIVVDEVQMDELLVLEEDNAADKSEVIGNIVAIFSMERMERDLNTMIRFTVQLTLLVISIAIFFGYYFASALTRPLAMLVDATKKIADGDLSYKGTSEYKDEIGHLSESFGIMVSELADDIARREKVENELRESKLRFQALANKAPVGIFQFNTAGACVFVNPRGLEILDATEPEILEHSWLERIHDDDKERIIQEWVDFVTLKSVFYSEFRFVHHQEDVVWVIAEAYPEVTDLSEVRGFIGTITDVTPLKLITEELKRSNAELDSFARIASHDLKEPMRKIQTFGSILDADYSDALGEDGCAYLSRVMSAAKRMQSLIDGLLIYSRVTTKAMPFCKLNLKEVTLEVLSDLEVALEQSKGKVNVSDFPDILGDPLQIRQLMQNLISNSIKYQRDNIPPVIDITARIANDMLEVTVSDNGIGFDSHHADRIFGVFERLHGRSEKYEGTGVGLSICKKITERHGGSIRAHGECGEGAEFIFTLPLYKDSMNA